MQQADLFLLFTAPLDRATLTYMVTGSVASMAYGEPRLTNDIDIVIELPVESVGILSKAFPLSEFYCPPEEVMIVEARRASRGHFNIIHHESGHKADIYMRGQDPLQAWGLERRSWLDLSSAGGIWLAPPEYVIVRKLEYFREGGSEKHVQDIQGILAVSGDQLDRASLTRWTEHLDLAGVWRTVDKGR
jgi:hypothetical protein